MAKTLPALLCLALVGCDGGPAWQTSPANYSCDTAQMQKVMGETGYCKQQTDYSGAYCYGAAIIRNCQPIKETK